MSTLIYNINIVVAGFCIGRKHAFFSSALYLISFLPLIIISKDTFLSTTGLPIFFLIPAFALAISAFLRLLEVAHNKEIFLKEQLYEKDKALNEEYNKQLRNILESKEKEIVAKTMLLLELEENNNTFISKLNSIKEGLKISELKKINEIINQHKLGNRERYWKEFEASFLEIHPDFYKNLIHQCSKLSPSELKLSALIKLGLSSKQIATLCSISPESVDVTRSKIRSKLNLANEANLRTFLLNI